MHLTKAQTDRACGVLLAAACGDALGAGYEFGVAPLAADDRPAMIGGGLGSFAPGEWTDDTSQAFVIAQVAATGADLRSTDALDRIAQGFADWYAGNPPDVGIQTARILRAVGRTPTAAAMTAASRAYAARTARAAGNGSLMRTAPVALAHLDDADALVEAATAVSALTHADPRAQQACALWCLAIRHTVLTGDLPDLRGLTAQLPAAARPYWRARIDEAEQADPGTFSPNGWTVAALQAAWSAIVHTPVPALAPGDGVFPAQHLVAALETAVHIGDDTDTVAAVAGALLGARWGASAAPAAWRRLVHGWPGKTGEDLVHLAHLAATGRPGKYGWPLVAKIDYSWQHGYDTLVAHPHDPKVLLGGAGALDGLPEQVTAVVSMCLTGTDQVPPGIEHVVFRLLDEQDPRANPNLHQVLDDAATTVQTLRRNGHMVLLHCVAAHSRTPSVAIRYAQRLGIDPGRAFDEVCAALPHAHPNAAFRAALADFARSAA